MKPLQFLLFLMTVIKLVHTAPMFGYWLEQESRLPSFTRCEAQDVYRFKQCAHNFPNYVNRETDEDGIGFRTCFGGYKCPNSYKVIEVVQRNMRADRIARFKKSY